MTARIPPRNAFILFAYAALCLGCMQDTSSEFLWRTMASGKAGPPELPYGSGIRVDSLSSRVLIDSDSIAIPTGLFLIGTRLVVKDPMASPLLRIVDAQTGALLGGMGARGGGPGEFRVSPGLVAARGQFAPGDSMLWLYDSDRGRTRLSLANVKAARILDSATIDLEGRALEVLWDGDSLLVSTEWDTSSALVVRDRAGKIVRRVRADTSGWGRIPASDFANARHASMCADPGGSRLALAYRWADRVEVYTMRGVRQVVVKTPHGFPAWVDIHPLKRSPSFSSGSPNVRSAYWACAATDKHIFALYSGRRHKDFRRAMHECWYVHVFDWSGNLVRVIRLDHGSASLAVNAAGTTLYTGDVTSTTNPLRVTEIPR